MNLAQGKKKETKGKKPVGVTKNNAPSKVYLIIAITVTNQDNVDQEKSRALVHALRDLLETVDDFQPWRRPNRNF